MVLTEKDWYSEQGCLNSELVTLNLKCDKILHREKSKYQDLLVFHSPKFGNCLVLDDCIQITDLDECSYSEMISFLPINSHPSPKRVLIIGGGDLAVATQVLKHPLVDEVVLCEIDEAVVRVCKEFFPKFAVSSENPKFSLIIDDGIEYVKNHKEYFDVIITDSSDPKGPAEVLFQNDYYRQLSECLRSGGIICSQAETFWYDMEVIKNLFTIAKNHFKTVSYAYTLVPSYPSGQIGFLICNKDKIVNFSNPFYQLSEKQMKSMKLKYYSAQTHTAAFALPSFIKEELGLE